jgi:putative restriction endonuclease
LDPSTHSGRTVYLEPSKVRNSRGYFAVAKVERIIPDPTAPGMFLALIEPGTYLDFMCTVPFSGPEGPIECGVLNEAGAISGRAQAAVRSLSAADFARIVRAGLQEADIMLPRVDDDEALDRVHDLQAPFHVERPIIERLIAKPERNAFFRRAVLQAYDETCAVTGWKLINGGGRADRRAAPRSFRLAAFLLLLRRLPPIRSGARGGEQALGAELLVPLH